MVRIVVVLLLLALLPSAAHAQKRVALVIGNSAYQHTPKLTNPKNDATDMVVVLKKHGFQVLEGFDLDKVAFDRKIRDFAAALASAQAGVFFYAGHGLQVSGHNYLVPVDAQLSTASALDFEMVRLDLVHRTMEREAQTNILFLDACRDNPLARNLARAMGTRSTEIGRGLAQVEGGVGTLISFSTQPGNVALDGAGRNSPFAGALVKQLATSNDDLSAILIGVRNDVMKETQRRQVPWEHSALTGRFYFDPAGQTTAPPTVALPRLSEAAEAWGAVKDSTSVAALEAYVARYKDTFYAELARQRIDDLKKQQVAVATTPPAARPAAPAKDPLLPGLIDKTLDVVLPRDKPAGRCEGVEAPVAGGRRCLKPKESFRDCPECPEMVVIPAGEFLMGSPDTEEGHAIGESPQHAVRIQNPFAVGKFEVSFAEWDACASASGCGGVRPNDAGWGRGNLPVIRVSWQDAKTFVTWLNSRTGKTYRLLTEAEWEYVARAGSGGAFWWGNAVIPTQANYNSADDHGSYGGSQKAAAKNRTVPVNSFAANPFGLYNVHGNVFEWVEDCWHPNYIGAPNDGAARIVDNCTHRMIRGGAWSVGPIGMRAASRSWYPPTDRGRDIGFRVARTL